MDLTALNAILEKSGCHAANKVVWFDRIDSTNDYLMNLEDAHGAVCLAGMQNAGRGRRGNRWQAPYGSSVLMSIGWRMDVRRAQGLSLACAVAVRRALRKVGVENVRLKWPNDLFLRNAKFAGLLIELSDSKCVVGLGMNIKIDEGQTQSPERTSLPWTDLYREGYEVDKVVLLDHLITGLCDALEEFCRFGFGPFMEEWNRCHLFHLSKVDISGDRSISGQVVGVNENGGLIIHNESGDHEIYSGAVSLRLKPQYKN